MSIGLLYGIGAGMLFGPSIHLMAEWFKVKKSLAYGFMCVSCSNADFNALLILLQLCSRRGRWSRIAPSLHGLPKPL
jgi:hypothetical protein